VVINAEEFYTLDTSHHPIDSVKIVEWTQSTNSSTGPPHPI